MVQDALKPIFTIQQRGGSMSEESKDDLNEKLGQLRSEHRDLDDILTRMSDDHSINDLQLKRMKKRKLYLKDAITRLETELLPDMRA
jgi:hypothetical protein